MSFRSAVLVGILLASLLFLPARADQAGAPVLSADIVLHDISYDDSQASGQLSLRVCNLANVEIRNINVRAASGADRLNQGVVQLGAIAGDSCKSINTEYLLDTVQLDEAGGIPIRIQYDIGSSSYEVLEQADVVDVNS